MRRTTQHGIRRARSLVLDICPRVVYCRSLECGGKGEKEKKNGNDKNARSVIFSYLFSYIA